MILQYHPLRVNRWVSPCSTHSMRAIGVVVLQIFLFFSGSAFSASFNCGKVKTDVENNICAALHQQPQICVEISKLLALWQGGRAPESVPKNFIIEYQSLDGGDTLYPSLDIDGDAINDHVLRSCGAGKNANCTLLVELSSGERLELEEEHFFLVRVKSAVYVIVGETSEAEKKKLGKRRFYQITKQAITLLCPHI